MMETEIFHLANILRIPSRDVFSGKGKLCLSANYLDKLNKVIDSNIEEDVTSFHIVQTNNTKSNTIRDTQFLIDLINKTINLKLIIDETQEFTLLDLTQFRNIKALEVIKLDIKLVTGLQKLRAQIQELTCCKSLKTISEVLEKCGGDLSQPYSWNELRIANLSHNEIIEIDNSFEYTLSLHTLDLSHNYLDKANFINLLPNLKHLNLSYNKLDSVPNFKGQIRSRLQVLVLNNNFVENLSGLNSLSNLLQLDLGHNCLLDHKVLLSISHLISLQWLNCQGNPFAFHPHHRHLTCNYLNKNASTGKFVLDGVILNRTEKTLTGSLYPVTQSFQTSSSSTNSQDISVGSIQDKPKKIRNVTIQDSSVVEEVLPTSTPTSSSQHLKIKYQVEQLRNEYGESWLYRHSGLIVQDVLGLEKGPLLSSTPLENEIEQIINKDFLDIKENNDLNVENASACEIPSRNENETFCTAEDDSSIFGNDRDAKVLSDGSDGEDIFSGGEDCMFIATNTGDNTEVFVVVTDSYISECDVITSKEKARWHINTIISCEKCTDNENCIKLEFDTLRRDRKQRIYELSTGESQSLYDNVKEKINSVVNSKTKVEGKHLIYQCMKCSNIFQRSKHALVDNLAVACPECTSDMVVEKG